MHEINFGPFDFVPSESLVWFGRFSLEGFWFGSLGLVWSVGLVWYVWFHLAFLRLS